MDRVNLSTGTYWEEHVGYSRAVKVDNMIYISGTTAIENNKVVGVHSAYEQTKFVIKKIGKVLTELNSKLEDVVRIRIYLADISTWKEVAKAYSEFFKDIKPAQTLIEVKGLVDPSMLVEIEADAVLLKL
jgi:enamine deaminase RidA (YjgF/YER057c/UK114 family)